MHAQRHVGGEPAAAARVALRARVRVRACACVCAQTTGVPSPKRIVSAPAATFFKARLGVCSQTAPIYGHHSGGRCVPRGCCAVVKGGAIGPRTFPPWASSASLGASWARPGSSGARARRTTAALCSQGSEWPGNRQHTRTAERQTADGVARDLVFFYPVSGQLA
jgi:hypothetical protein